MPTIYKQLGARAATGTITNVDNLYGASGTASTSTVVSSLVICNTGASSAKVRVGINTASTAYATGRYVIYDSSIAAYDTVALTLGLVLDPTNRFMNVSSDSASVNFSLYGAENT